MEPRSVHSSHTGRNYVDGSLGSHRTPLYTDSATHASVHNNWEKIVLQSDSFIRERANIVTGVAQRSDSIARVFGQSVVSQEKMAVADRGIDYGLAHTYVFRIPQSGV
jgi:hypothetical protein